MQRGDGRCKSPPGPEKVAFAPRPRRYSKGRRDFPLQKNERPHPGKFRWYRGIAVALSLIGLGAFFVLLFFVSPPPRGAETQRNFLLGNTGERMIVIQTTIDRRAMTALARMTRKTVRRGRNGPVRMMAWLVVALESWLVYISVRHGLGGWGVNALLGGVMLACLLSEDWINGTIGLHRLSPGELEVNTAFQEDSCYVCRSRDGERWWPYSEIMTVVETKDYFALLLDRKRGQVFDKRGFTWGNPEEFRALIRKKTGLNIQTVR